MAVELFLLAAGVLVAVFGQVLPGWEPVIAAAAGCGFIAVALVLQIGRHR